MVKHADSQHRGYQFDFSMYPNKNAIDEEGNGKPPEKIYLPRKNSKPCLCFLLRLRSSMRRSRYIFSFQSLYWMKHFSFRLAVINVCRCYQCVSSACALRVELLLSTHLPTSEGWTAEFTVGLWTVVPTTGFEPTRVDLA